MRQNSISFRNSNLSSFFVLITSTLFAMTCLIGCKTSAKFIQTGPSLAAKTDDCPIEVFSSKLPKREYSELGIIEGEGKYDNATLEKVLPKLKQEACRAGGDAIIIKTVQKYIDSSDDEKIHVTATVVKWQD